MLFDLDHGVKTERAVLIGPGGTERSCLIDTIRLLLVVRSRRESQARREDAIRRRHSALVETAFTGLAASNISGLILRNALKRKVKYFMSDVSDSSFPRLQQDWRDVQG